MCMQLYICSNNKLDEIPWDKEKPEFAVSLVEDTKIIEKYVKKRTNKKFIYEFVSYNGCGCGFFTDDYFDLSDDDDKEELRKNLNDLEKLFKYLRKMSLYDKELIIYTCWNGEEYKEIKKEQKLDLNINFRNNFSFEQNYIYRIKI